MFSPDATLHGSLSLRNPRRRHRTTSEESLSTRQSNKRRKRSSLAPDTFETPSISKANGHAKQVNGNAKDATPDPINQRDAGIDTTALAVRGRVSKRDKRVRKDDGSTQAKNDHYVITKEHGLPNPLLELLGKEQWHGVFSPGLGYAVAVTNTQAIVWPCSSKTNKIESSKPYVIKLPNNLSNRSSKDPLPHAAIVHDAGAGELALMVAMPNGKLIYWESVAGAASTEVARPRQQGLQASIGGMFSSETISDMTEAEPDGFILTSSIGRVIHVSVRDPQGRPSMNINYLRSSTNTNGGLFGSFKNVFSSSSWKREIAATRAGPLRGKNNRHCIVANVQGLFQVWDLARHGARELVFEHDVKDEILRNIQNVDTAINNSHLDFRMLDFTIFPGEKGKLNESDKLLVLTALTNGRQSHYFLIDLTLREDSTDVNVVYPVTCWNEPPAADSNWLSFKPRVLLPSPGHTAFLVFDTYVIVISLGKIEESPSSQLQTESKSLSEPYQDILFLNKENFDHFVGCTVESPGRDSDEATCLLLANTFGLVRATAFPSVEDVTRDQQRAALCRSRIEQAVFFGYSKSNLFDLRYGLSAVDWSRSEIETATAEVNSSILDNRSSYIPTMIPSMEHQLRLRAAALADLIKCTGKYALSRGLRWHLLWTAEKLASARAVWQTYNDTLARKDPSDTVLLAEIIDMISENNKHENRPEVGEVDIVRHFLEHDASRMDLIIIWAEYGLEKLNEESSYSQSQQAKLVSQANNIQISALEAAFAFRQSNAEMYGIGKEATEEGVFQGNYSEIPDCFWTSADLITKKVKELAQLAKKTIDEDSESPIDEDVDIQDLEIKINLDNPKLVLLACKVYDERIRYLASRSDEQSHAAATELAKEWANDRRELLTGLSELGLIDDAFRIAEYYSDMDALAEVFGDFETECAYETCRDGISDEELAAVKQRVKENALRKERYFRTYGTRWANAVYDRKLMGGELSGLLIEDQQYHDFLTQYLRGKSDLNALAWMHEIGQGDYTHAAEGLSQVQKDEQNLWSKKIELSLAKLSILAAAEKDQVSGTALSKSIKKSDRRLKIVHIQEQLYEYASPLFMQALDKAAAIDIAMDTFGGFVADKPFLKGLLRKHLQSLINMKSLDAEELIDSLTLMSTSPQIPGLAGFFKDRFFHTLKLIEYGGFSGDRKALHLKMLWRRCLLQDDWADFNRTEKKDELAVAEAIEGTVLFQTLKSGFQNNILEICPPQPPSELFGAGTAVESLRLSARYTQTPDHFLKSLAQDHETEDKALALAVDKGRLEKWWPGIIEGTKEVIRKEADADGNIEADRQLAKNAVELEISGQLASLGGDDDGDIAMA